MMRDEEGREWCLSCYEKDAQHQSGDMRYHPVTQEGDHVGTQRDRDRQRLVRGAWPVKEELEPSIVNPVKRRS